MMTIWQYAASFDDEMDDAQESANQLRRFILASLLIQCRLRKRRHSFKSHNDRDPSRQIPPQEYIYLFIAENAVS